MVGAVRRLIPALLLLAVPSLALGEDIDAAMTRAIFALATMGYADPGKAVMRDVHKLLTRNGKGYCGGGDDRGQRQLHRFPRDHR